MGNSNVFGFIAINWNQEIMDWFSEKDCNVSPDEVLGEMLYFHRDGWDVKTFHSEKEYLEGTHYWKLKVVLQREWTGLQWVVQDIVEPLLQYHPEELDLDDLNFSFIKVRRSEFNNDNYNCRVIVKGVRISTHQGWKEILPTDCGENYFWALSNQFDNEARSLSFQVKRFIREYESYPFSFPISNGKIDWELYARK